MAAQFSSLIQNMNSMFTIIRDENQHLREGMAQLWDLLAQQRQTPANTTPAPTQTNRHQHPSRHPSPPQSNSPSHQTTPTIYHPHTSPHTPPTKTETEQITTRLHQEKAFKNLLNASAHKFNGKDVLEYAPWKKALAIELKNIQLSSTQHIQLLEERTELEPNQVIKDLKCIQSELGPDTALDMVWETFDKIYHTPTAPRNCSSRN